MRWFRPIKFLVYLAPDKLIVVPAVEVPESIQLNQSLFDLHCWHINTTPYQNSFQPKELQLTFDPSPLLPLGKEPAFKFCLLTAWFKKKKKKERGIWSSPISESKGGAVESLVKWTATGFVLKVLMKPSSSLLNLLLLLTSLTIYKQTSAVATCLSVCSFAGD